MCKLRVLFSAAVLAACMAFPVAAYAAESEESEVSEASSADITLLNFRLVYHDGNIQKSVSSGSSQPSDFVRFDAFRFNLFFSNVAGSRSVFTVTVPCLEDGCSISSVYFTYPLSGDSKQTIYPAFSVSGSVVTVVMNWDSMPDIAGYSSGYLSVSVTPRNVWPELSDFSASVSSFVSGSNLFSGVTSLLSWVLDSMTNVCTWILGNSLAFIFVGLLLAGCGIGFLFRVLNSV